jgi:hypothetical protein
MLRAIVTVALLFAIGGCDTQTTIDKFKPPESLQQEQRALLVGKWFGDAVTKEGDRRLQITQRAADGTYKVTFRLIDRSGKISEQSEVGFWGISGSVYFTITRGWLKDERLLEANPTDASLNDAYQVLELTQERFRYRTLQSGSEYSLTRVDDAFEFPASRAQ